MKFSEVVAQTIAWLQREGRVSYRALKREFDVEDDFLEDLKEELITIKELAVDKDGKMLVWVGQGINGEKDKRIDDNTEGEKANWGKDEKEGVPGQWTPPHLAERIRAEQAALEARSGTDGERKTITALFADLKGSTALIEGLDPEEARAIIDPALQLMMDAVHQYDGYVAQALGDGIFALFGAPLAHEDHPQRALYAALRMQEAMRRYADTLRAKGYPPLLMRVGLNTGEVVLRSIRKDDLHADYVPIGHSTNLAARMEQLANPGTIVVSAYTHRLADGYFAFKDLGPTQIKGVEEALNIYEVLSVGPLRTRLQVSARRGLTRFVGRQNEMEQLNKALEYAKAGQGQIVGVMGEPGLGKSCLFYEFKLTSQTGCFILEAYSVSHGKATAYLPVIELLKSYFDIQAQDDERKRREKVTGKVLSLDRSLEDTLPYLFALLGITDPSAALQQMDAQIRRRRTFEALKKLFLRESLNQPLVLVFEDLHWIDEETQGFLDVLSESVASAKILLLTNYHPEYRHEWGQKTYYTQLRLAPLGRAEAEEFLDVLLGTTVGAQHAAPLQALKQLILEKTEGTPFFMEEIVQELAEQGVLRQDSSVGWVVTHPTITLQLPTTVQGVLAARIDRLAPDEKALLQQLAVIGREFPLSLIRQVIIQAEDDLYRLLSSLQHKEFLYEQPAFPEVEYIFKHALTQEVAYNSVLQERRKILHEKIAQAIEQLYHDRLEEHYDELAHHYQRSGNTTKAVHYLHLAAQQAVQRSAHGDAARLVSTALELLRVLPNTPERARQELHLQTMLGHALIVTKGYGAPEAEQALLRARDLCQQVNEPGQLFLILLGLGHVYGARGELETTLAIDRQMVVLAQQYPHLDVLSDTHYMLAGALFRKGEFLESKEIAEQGLALYDPARHSIHAVLYNMDPGVGNLHFVGLNLALLGYVDQAVEKINQALVLAQKVAHPVSLSLTLSFACVIRMFQRENLAVREHRKALARLADEQELPLFMLIARAGQGWEQAINGQLDEGLVLLRAGIDGLSALQATAFHPYWLSHLAETYWRSGKTAEGLATVEDALTYTWKTGERWYESELYRLKGELTLQKFQISSSTFQVADPRPLIPNLKGEVEACFLKAIEIARKQQAKSLELRATMSLARRWQQQGKQHDAHKMLVEIYNWFTEGFDTKDLQEAKILLEELQ